MKFVIAAAAAAAMAALVPAAAQAQEAAGPVGAYGNIGYSYIDVDGDHLDAIQGRVGYRFMPFVGVEGEAAFGIGGASETVDLGNGQTITGSVKLKHELAAYAVGFAPINPNFDLLARIGYGTQKLKASAGGVSDSTSVESVNYGVGAQYHWDGVNGVRGEWTRYDFNSGFGHADVFSVSYSRRF
jgi:outer membrane immunogenic protein